MIINQEQLGFQLRDNLGFYLKNPEAARTEQIKCDFFMKTKYTIFMSKDLNKKK